MLLGATPPRTDYEYVRKISKPLVHESLLQMFRTEKLSKEEDMAANMALPLSDSEDEEPIISSSEDKESVFSDGINVHIKTAVIILSLDTI